MEEAVDTPAAATPAAEPAPEAEPTKETEAPVVESTTEETKGNILIYRDILILNSRFYLIAAEASTEEPMEAETTAEGDSAPAATETSEAPAAASETPVAEAGDAPAAAPQQCPCPG